MTTLVRCGWKSSERTENWIYGLNPVLEAVRAGRRIMEIYISSGRHKEVHLIRKEAEAGNIAVKEVPLSFFEERFPKGHQGIAARVRERGYTPLEELLEIPAKKNEHAFFLVLDGIEDPRNFGAIIRSSEAAGVHGVVIQSHRAAGFSPVVSKASAGAVEYVPVSMVPNIKHAISAMKEDGIAIIGAEGGKGLSPYDTDLTIPLALVLGSEGVGLRKTVRDKCDRLLSLPMRGKVNSLNVSVATGILLYEILRQKLKKT